jgi:hypothetical protein
MFLKFQQSHTISSMRINIISYTFHVSPSTICEKILTAIIHIHFVLV